MPRKNQRIKRDGEDKNDWDSTSTKKLVISFYGLIGFLYGAYLLFFQLYPLLTSSAGLTQEVAGLIIMTFALCGGLIFATFAGAALGYCLYRGAYAAFGTFKSVENAVDSLGDCLSLSSHRLMSNVLGVLEKDKKDKKDEDEDVEANLPDPAKEKRKRTSKQEQEAESDPAPASESTP